MDQNYPNRSERVPTVAKDDRKSSKNLEKISVKGCKNLTEDCFPGLNLAYKAMTKDKDEKFWKQLTWAKPDEFQRAMET